jgi:hypothetical protein
MGHFKGAGVLANFGKASDRLAELLLTDSIKAPLMVAIDKQGRHTASQSSGAVYRLLPCNILTCT